jgi:hypothetical protein
VKVRTRRNKKRKEEEEINGIRIRSVMPLGPNEWKFQLPGF